MGEVWIVRAIKPYRRQVNEKTPAGPQRPKVKVPRAWENGGGGEVGSIDVPVFAETAEEAEEKALADERVERIRGPTTKIKAIR